MYPEYESIFVESSEELGILYNSYKPVLAHLDNFLSIIEDTIKKFNDDPSSVHIDLSIHIKKFKEDIEVEKNPEPIKIGTIKDTSNLLKKFKSNIEDCLERYAAAKKKVSYGGSALKAVVNRPKVYANNIDEDSYENNSKIIRNINRSLDWIEKCIIDLYALVDQDLNLLNIVNRVYAKNKIYENAIPAGIEVEDVATSVIQMLPNATGEAVSSRTIVNTRDKKTGKPPKYLLNNHDMAKYGEEDSDEEQKKDSDKEITLDDYKRPSVEEDDKPKNVDPIIDDEPEVDDKKDDSIKHNTGTTNYYYYTYTNSMNRHSHDDHSIHDSNNTTKKIDNSIHGNINNGNISSKPREKEFKALESSPWELNVNLNTLIEATGDADDNKPKSDHPVKDTLMDIDRSTAKVQQGAKRTVQNVQNVGRAAMKPVNRTKQWIGNVINNWKDKSETEIKEEMADPNSRSKLFKAIKNSIKIGALWQAGLLMNPIFISIAAFRRFEKNKNKFRLRNEMIGELKAEMEIIDEKIKDADQNGDNKAKYQLMRFKNEVNKKLLRVGGDYDGKRRWSKIL
jgi:hypothetical protein